MLIHKKIQALHKIHPRYFEYIIVLATILFSTTICFFFSNILNYYVVSYIFLFIVSIFATFMHINAVLLASTLSALIWNFFFIPPHFTFHIKKIEDILLFILFYIIAIVNGVLTTKIRKQEQLAIDKANKTNALFELTRDLSISNNVNEIIEISKRKIYLNFKQNFDFIIQNGNEELIFTDEIISNNKLNENDINIIEYVFQNKRDTIQNSRKFYSLNGSRVNLGVLISDVQMNTNDDTGIFWQTFKTQIINALEREFLAELASSARFLAESDKLYKTLFNSISHEFRIPVATILGASDTLIQTDQSIEICNELYCEIFKASLRLNRLIENLLNISRIENGRISPRLDWNDCNDLINKVTDDLKEELSEYLCNVEIQKNMPLVQFDFGLMEQVLYNLLINSCEFAPKQTEIKIKVNYISNELVISISDNGPGFPPDSLNKVFTKFFRINAKKTGSLGLGLSIVKGFVEAHNGRVFVESNSVHGVTFTIKIPTKQYEC